MEFIKFIRATSVIPTCRKGWKNSEDSSQNFLRPGEGEELNIWEFEYLGFFPWIEQFFPWLGCIRIESKHEVTILGGLNEFVVKFYGPQGSKCRKNWGKWGNSIPEGKRWENLNGHGEKCREFPQSLWKNFLDLAKAASLMGISVNFLI